MSNGPSNKKPPRRTPRPTTPQGKRKHPHRPANPNQNRKNQTKKPSAPPSPTKPTAPSPAGPDTPQNTNPARPPQGPGETTKATKKRTAGDPRRRSRAMFIALLFIFTVFAAQLVRLQAIDAETIAQQAQRLRSRPTPIPAKRGTIQDRYGAPLAESSERFDIVVDQVAVAEYTKKDPNTKKSTKVGAAGAAADLAPILGIDEKQLATSMTGRKPWVPIARSVVPTTWLKVQGLKIPGITNELVPIRYYPGGEPAAATVGWVGSDGTAKGNTGGGLEYLYNQALTGRPGKIVREYSLDNRVIPMGNSKITPAVPGEVIRTTIDNDLNWFAHDAIAKQVQDLGAEAGVIVIMDKQGRLLAVTQAPSFDPADRGRNNSDFSNMAFQGAFEPGSVTKIITAGAALDLGLTTPTTQWEIPNRYTVDGQEFRDSHDHPTEHLTTAGVLAKSSNIGTVKLAQLYPREKLAEYMQRFGLGERTAVGFPGESAGYLGDPSTWDGRSRYTISFGQAFTATPVQVTGIMQTIANKGIHIPPSLIAGRTDVEGQYHPQPLPQQTQAVSKETASQLGSMLQSVVSNEGTALQAAVPGFNIAGKTGTSNRYTGKGGYVSSFVGYAPADDPQFVMGVFLVNPKKDIYGGSTSGPVFSSVMSHALQKYGIAPSGAKIAEFPLTFNPSQATPTPQSAPAGGDKPQAVPPNTPETKTGLQPPAVSPTDNTSTARRR
ncbi:penicillin-binding transpeptidase domain-containing protein [Dermatophilus congolensis]|uniref:penicillin-binding transpeptidase domain-containing protein n=1 Tax=Dermatophilus congolensis TaxID=1863 RepID=UPI001AAF539B|nr:penicillin-binding protein 2 [Dermatophilus congolensis]MBO3151326.1 penicillin-binding protein 2 [Dermatophilus congolensis]MBO3162612.1 penicillin-binding protein 2 [Dermatophilus congolensis]MBO3176165.1 penicillin-binding protein 2 [Dermatophilus congolensis]MBO3182924.1 penicillin-binding protein 2 [Dermatophilus congolensis]